MPIEPNWEAICWKIWPVEWCCSTPTKKKTRGQLDSRCIMFVECRCLDTGMFWFSWSRVSSPGIFSLKLCVLSSNSEHMSQCSSHVCVCVCVTNIHHLDGTVGLKATKGRYQDFPCCFVLGYVVLLAIGWVQRYWYEMLFANSCHVNMHCVHDMWVPQECVGFK